jgi:hypothetical protein
LLFVSVDSTFSPSYLFADQLTKLARLARFSLQRNGLAYCLAFFLAGRVNLSEAVPSIFFSSFLKVIDCFASGLPDGIFANKKYQCGYILEKLAMETFSVFDDFWVVFCQLVHFVVIWYIFSRFGIFFSRFGIFFPVLVYCPRKIWQPCFGFVTLVVK